MSRATTDQINRYFSAVVRNVTPASVRPSVCVLYAPFLHDPGISTGIASVLSEAELQRSDRFAHETEKCRFRQRRAFRRFCGAVALGRQWSLSRIAFEETENGRPYLCESPDTWFSFSSCGSGFLGAWSSTHGIGVDIEDTTREIDAVELADQYFLPAEAAAVKQADRGERSSMFFRFWCLKEAALKSIGEGLPFGLDAFQFELAPDLRVVNVPSGHGGAESFDAHLIDGTGESAALVSRTPG